MSSSALRCDLVKLLVHTDVLSCGQMAFLQSEVKAKEAVIAELMAEVASVSHSRSKSNSIWSNNHDRKLSTLKHNLDDMGFDAGRVSSLPSLLPVCDCISYGV